jgi:hypothetical protein
MIPLGPSWLCLPHELTDLHNIVLTINNSETKYLSNDNTRKRKLLPKESRDLQMKGTHNTWKLN